MDEWKHHWWIDSSMLITYWIIQHAHTSPSIELNKNRVGYRINTLLKSCLIWWQSIQSLIWIEKMSCLLHSFFRHQHLRWVHWHSYSHTESWMFYQKSNSSIKTRNENLYVILIHLNHSIQFIDFLITFFLHFKFGIQHIKMTTMALRIQPIHSNRSIKTFSTSKIIYGITQQPKKWRCVGCEM